MSLLGRLLGTEKAMTASVEALRDGLDALYYSDEEKAQDASKERSEARMMVVQWMHATQGQNLARRLIALILTSIWSLQYIGYFGLSMAAIWVDNPKQLIESAELLKEGADQMGGAMMLILAFYFSAPYMDKIVTTAVDKFNGTQSNSSK